MSKAMPRARDLAERLTDYEIGAGKSPGTRTASVFAVCEKLRPQLAILMGNIGYRALVSRALARAGAEVPLLRRLRVTVDGSLAGFEDIEVRADREELARNSAILVSQLLGLMVTFIGEPLVLRIVRDVWPELAISDLNLYGKDKK